MNKPNSPQKSANDISLKLTTVFGRDRFPVDVQAVAREISHQKFADDPIIMIRGADLPGFEGALTPAPPGKKGWGIIYNSSVKSKGRVNFTLAHEFYHYLGHRIDHPQGFQCTSEDMANWNSEYGQLEQEANTFAANLLMPLDDFRSQIDAKSRPNLDEIRACAIRYEASLIATILRWLQYTTKRSMLVVSTEGYIRWARSSRSALKSGLYIKTRSKPPIEMPGRSLAQNRSIISGNTGNVEHENRTWFNEPCQEHVLFSDQYDFTISLLHFDDNTVQLETELEQEDTYDRMINRALGQP